MAKLNVVSVFDVIYLSHDNSINPVITVIILSLRNRSYENLHEGFSNWHLEIEKTDMNQSVLADIRLFLDLPKMIAKI